MITASDAKCRPEGAVGIQLGHDFVLRLTDLREYKADQAKLRLALQSKNRILSMDGLAVGFSGSRPFLRQAENLVLDEVELMKPTPATDEAEFLRHEFKESLRIDDLGLDAIVTLYLQARVDEIQACPRDKVPLGVIFLLGSTLEGLLLAFALQDKARFTSSAAAPKDTSGRVKNLQDWSLNEFIDVAHEVGLPDLDFQRFSHVLRAFAITFILRTDGSAGQPQTVIPPRFVCRCFGRPSRSCRRARASGGAGPTTTSVHRPESIPPSAVTPTANRRGEGLCRSHLARPSTSLLQAGAERAAVREGWRYSVRPAISARSQGQ
jgi:hypothetical protein